jgi:hypothetical protein
MQPERNRNSTPLEVIAFFMEEMGFIDNEELDDSLEFQEYGMDDSNVELLIVDVECWLEDTFDEFVPPIIMDSYTPLKELVEEMKVYMN